MAELKATPGLDAIEATRQFGAVSVGVVETGQVTSISPYRRKEAEVSARLRATLDLDLPAPGSLTRAGAARLIWTGLGQWFLAGAKPPALNGLAALTDQSGGWVAMEITGAGAASVMARLGPLDYATMSAGHVARSELAHMMSIQIARADGFELWVMRSFACTALSHIHDAAASEAAIRSLRSET